MSSKILPINKNPLVQTEGLHTYCLSIVDNSKYFKEWFYSTHTLVIFANTDGAIQFRFESPHSHQCTLLDTEMFNDYKSIDGNNMLQKVISKLQNDNYIYTILNERYVKNTAAKIRGFDFGHPQLVYGYSDDKQEIYAMIYDINRKYCETIITYDDFVKGYDTLQTNDPYKFFKINNTILEYNWASILCEFVVYHENKEIHEIEGCKLNGFVSYGALAIRHLQKQLLRIKDDTNFDYRYIPALKDHKTVIFDKLIFLKNMGVEIQDIVFEQYAKVLKEADICQSLYIKFEIVRDNKVIDNIISKIDEMLEIESKLFPMIIQNIIEHAKRNNLIDWL